MVLSMVHKRALRMRKKLITNNSKPSASKEKCDDTINHYELYSKIIILNLLIISYVENIKETRKYRL